MDEELDGEIIESQVSAREYATLIESSDPELTEASLLTLAYNTVLLLCVCFQTDLGFGAIILTKTGVSAGVHELRNVCAGGGCCHGSRTCQRR